MTVCVGFALGCLRVVVARVIVVWKHREKRGGGNGVTQRTPAHSCAGRWASERRHESAKTHARVVNDSKVVSRKKNSKQSASCGPSRLIIFWARAHHIAVGLPHKSQLRMKHEAKRQSDSNAKPHNSPHAPEQLALPGGCSGFQKRQLVVALFRQPHLLVRARFRVLTRLRVAVIVITLWAGTRPIDTTCHAGSCRENSTYTRVLCGTRGAAGTDRA